MKQHISIPAWCDWENKGLPSISLYPNFNSSVVRLGGSVNSIGFCVYRTYFNSSVVRLGETSLHDVIVCFAISIPAWCDWEVPAVKKEIMQAIFQFQRGAIGSFDHDLTACTCQIFQFQRGAIGRLSARKIHSRTCLISIPAWCDWELTFRSV